MLQDVPKDWRGVLAPVLESARGEALGRFLAAEEAAGKAIYPPPADRFHALHLSPPDAVKAVILGQDPYHGAGQAMGLAFSVPDGVKLPPSLKNIYREMENDLGISPPRSGDLTAWARQGVLLLNTSLSVEAGTAGSHAKRGWEAVTDACIAAVAQSGRPTVFILWGGHAQAKAPLIEAQGGRQHVLIETPHPSPLSAYRGFFGSQPFSRTNAFLEAHGREPVDWRLD
ncbi:uracil-DNA glycosylase [Erythrobacter litoralis]|uniref:uracil-DNA glycosylase n=1 Tax=Erythrobacter litoralis TaxID=39960 RepID=UPI002435E752|nr:uracil-DNA glycosylase [Erythrobacter litoralis]MDG6079314.1 uracil-DNA glycosylase [Erythrobacter litoralis]